MRNLPALASALLSACLFAAACQPATDEDLVGQVEEALAGDADSTFGTAGSVRTNITGSFNDGAYDVALQSDGKIVVAGAGAVSTSGTLLGASTLVRYNANGSRDTSFDGDGIATLSGALNAKGVAIQADGKIVICGTVGEALFVSRYNSNGSLDSSFGLGGTRTLALNAGSTPYKVSGEDVMITSNGKIVAVGTTDSSITFTGQTVKPANFVVVRLTAAGAFDNSFDSDGVVLLPYQNRATNALFAVKEVSGGKILGAGMTETVTTVNGTVRSTQHMALVRWNADGSLDTSFATGGVRVTQILAGSLDSRINDLAIQADGKIVAAGYAIDLKGGTTLESVVARYGSNGTPDPTFNGSGVFLSLVGGGSIANAMAIDASGRIVFAGYSAISGTFNIQMNVERLLSSGARDLTFGGGDGIAQINPGGLVSLAQGLAIQSDGKVVLAGQAKSSAGDFDHAVARLSN